MSGKILVLVASMLVTFVLGSVHAFSVLLVPLEQRLGLPRSEISLIYSVALVAITLAVLLGHRIYPRVASWWLAGGACLFAAAGLWLAAHATNWWLLLLGYSLAFGFANGIGYGYCLQLAARIMPEIRGLAMGAVTAAYALGSIAFARIFAWRILADSLASALSTAAFAVAVCGIAAASMLRLGRARYGAAPAGFAAQPSRLDGARVAQFWLAYLSSVFAGLMAIGHAAGIALAKGAEPRAAAGAAVMIGVGSAAGGFLAGGLLDRLPVSRLLIGIPLLTALALAGIALGDHPAAAIAWLAVAGFGYGSIIAVYPVAISACFGEQGPRVYGYVFTAWGFAGLVAPWSAGWIYDTRAGYDPAMLLAAGLACLSALCARVFRLGKIA